MCADNRSCCERSRKPDHVGDGAAAVLYGHFGIGYCRRCADAADQLCSNLRGAELNRACRGRGSCGLLCADGRLCGDEFQRKQMERTDFPGIGYEYAADGQYRKNPRIWIPPTLAAAITGPIATCLFRLQMNGPAVSSGMGTCGLVGQIGVYTGWLEEIAAGSRSQITAFDWIGMILICFVLPAVLSLVFGQILRKIGWIKEDDLKL